jgi:hypothetical protein
MSDTPDVSALDGHEQPCSYCQEPCDNFSAMPSRWSLYFPDPDQMGTGLGRYHHMGCVVERMAALTAQAERIVEMEAFVKTAAGPAYRDTTLGKAARALLEGKTS